MLTRQGWLVAAGAVALLAAGRAFGVVELFICGTAAGLVVLFSVLSVTMTRMRLAVGRTVTPQRVYAGNPSRVELAVRNDGPRTTRVLRLFDPVTGTRGADLLLGPLETTVTTRAAYRLPTERRGIVRIGPLEVIVGDSFGLATSSTFAAPVSELTVYPQVYEIVPIPQTSGHDPHAGADHPSALGRSGEDFYALRSYVMGDDLRKVHWPSTARRDDLMVRQDELPWQGRVTVLLDVRRNNNTDASLDLTASAAASVITASWKRRDLLRLMTTDGTDLGFAAGAAHAEAIMEHLATVDLSGRGSLRNSVEVLATSAAGSSLVIIMANFSEPEQASLMRMRGKFGSLTIVRFDASTWDRNAPVPPLSSLPPGQVVVTRELGFVDAWNRAAHPHSRRADAARAVGAST